MSRTPVLPTSLARTPDAPSSTPPLPAVPPEVRPKVPATEEPTAQAAISVPDDGFIKANSVSVFYGAHEAIKKVSLQMPRNNVIAMIGPSGCGKSTFLRSINRLNDLIPGCRV